MRPDAAVKVARSAARPSFGLPEVAIHTSRQSYSKAKQGPKSANICVSLGVLRTRTGYTADLPRAVTSAFHPPER